MYTPPSLFTPASHTLSSEYPGLTSWGFILSLSELEAWTPTHVPIPGPVHLPSLLWERCLPWNSQLSLFLGYCPGGGGQLECLLSHTHPTQGVFAVTHTPHLCTTDWCRGTEGCPFVSKLDSQKSHPCPPPYRLLTHHRPWNPHLSVWGRL